MCELCGPRISRRAALALAGGVIASTVSSGRTVSASSALAIPSELVIEPRSRWAGDTRPATGPLESEDVRFLLVHHSASEIGAEAIGVMRSVYDFHTGSEKGWPDVAYNFFIDHDGVVYEGRTGSLDGAVVPSATGGNQGFSQLVCLLGDFTSELPTNAAISSLIATLAWLADRHQVDTAVGATTSFVSRGSNLWAEGESVVADTVSGHREMSRTACPGDTFYPFLKSEVRSELATLPRSTAQDESVPVDSRVPPATRATVTPTTIPASTSAPSSTAIPTTPTTSGATSRTTLSPTTEVASSSTTQALSELSSEGAAPSAETEESSVNVPLALAGGAVVALGGAAIFRGVRGGGGAVPDDPEHPDSGAPNGG